MRTPHKGTLWGELSRYFGKEMEGASENACTGGKFPTILQLIRYSNTHDASVSSMGITLCRRSSAQDFLRDGDIRGVIFLQEEGRAQIPSATHPEGIML